MRESGRMIAESAGVGVGWLQSFARAAMSGCSVEFCLVDDVRCLVSKWVIPMVMRSFGRREKGLGGNQQSTIRIGNACRGCRKPDKGKGGGTNSSSGPLHRKTQIRSNTIPR